MNECQQKNFIYFALDFQIGKIIGKIFNRTFSNETSKLKIPKLHVLGLSLGAQLMGEAARTLIELSKGKYMIERYLCTIAHAHIT